MDKDTVQLPSTVDIRKITKDQWRDFEFLRHSMLKSDSESYTPNDFNDLKIPESEWIKRINEGIVIIAYDSISPVGIVRTKFNENASKIFDLYVLDSYKGTPLLQKLLEKLINETQDRGGIRMIEVDIQDTKNEEINMYEDLGFYENRKEGVSLILRKAI